jgi:hypothetical protein
LSKYDVVHLIIELIEIVAFVLPSSCKPKNGESSVVRMSTPFNQIPFLQSIYRAAQRAFVQAEVLCKLFGGSLNQCLDF